VSSAPVSMGSLVQAEASSCGRMWVRITHVSSAERSSLASDGPGQGTEVQTEQGVPLALLGDGQHPRLAVGALRTLGRAGPSEVTRTAA